MQCTWLWSQVSLEEQQLVLGYFYIIKSWRPSWKSLGGPWVNPTANIMTEIYWNLKSYKCKNNSFRSRAHFKPVSFWLSYKVKEQEERNGGGQRASRQTAEASAPLLHLQLQPSQGNWYPGLPPHHRQQQQQQQRLWLRAAVSPESLTFIYGHRVDSLSD